MDSPYIREKIPALVSLVSGKAKFVSSHYLLRSSSDVNERKNTPYKAFSTCDAAGDITLDTVCVLNVRQLMTLKTLKTHREYEMTCRVGPTLVTNNNEIL